MANPRILLVCLFILPMTVSVNAAQPEMTIEDTDPGVPAPEAVPASEEDGFDRFSLSLGLDFTNKYYFRGLLQEDDGVIAQPSLELGAILHESEEWSLSGFVGLWNSVHSEETGAADTDDFDAVWYEIDVYAGLSLTAGRLTTDLAYTRYASPNDAFVDVDEISVSFAWDDSGWSEHVTLSPYALVAFEVGDGQADGGDDRGIFLALGMEPSHTIDSTPVGPFTLSFPLEAGFSLSNYYEGGDGDDEFFGYFSAGIAGSVDLPAPEGFGAWSITVGIDYLLLGDTAEAVNNGSDSELLAHYGIAVEF